MFGFELNRQEDERKQDLPVIVSQDTDDGAVQLTTGFGAYGTYVDLDGSIRTEAELISKYRMMAEHPEIDNAIDNIVNDAIVADTDDDIVSINMDKVPLQDNIKEIIRQEFNQALQLLDFNHHAYEIFKRWYVDGRLYYQAVVDTKNPLMGIQELRFIDPRKIRKVRETKIKRDPRTNISMPITTKEYYLFNDKGFYNSMGSAAQQSPTNVGSGGVKIAKDSIVQGTSGITSAKGDMILSYLHKAIKALNNLRSMEDSLVIYRISRAPERRIFYIDVGNLPKMKAEQYLRDVMARFKNKIVYDATTGEIRDDRKFMTMLEDFWLPRREGGRGTEITTLPGGQNLSQIDDIMYFKKNLFQSLNVPITRLDPEAMQVYGHAQEITRDEVMFGKFVNRLRAKFATIFTKILERNLVLKRVMTIEDFDNYISPFVKYDFNEDNYFEEIKERTIMTERLTALQLIVPYIGHYFSDTWVRRHILKQSDAQIQQMNMEIQEEQQMLGMMQQSQPGAAPGQQKPPG